MVLTHEDFQEWKANPISRALFKVLEKEREFMKERLCVNNIDNQEEVRGRCSAILSLLELTYEDLVEGLRDE